MSEIVLKIKNMHCSSCAIRIDGDLEDSEGVKNSQTDFAKGITKIEYDDSKVTLENLKKVIEAAGYKVEG